MNETYTIFRLKNVMKLYEFLLKPLHFIIFVFYKFFRKSVAALYNHLIFVILQCSRKPPLIVASYAQTRISPLKR